MEFVGGLTEKFWWRGVFHWKVQDILCKAMHSLLACSPFSLHPLYFVGIGRPVLALNLHA